MLMNKKEFYTSPEVEAFEVRYEGVVCTSPQWGNNYSAGSGMSESTENTYDM